MQVWISTVVRRTGQSPLALTLVHKRLKDAKLEMRHQIRSAPLRLSRKSPKVYEDDHVVAYIQKRHVIQPNI